METTGQNTNNKILHKVAVMLTTFRSVNSLMTIQAAHTFLLVALHEGRSLTELATLSGYKLPTVSRTLLDLGVRNRRREPGWGLVETVVDPMELRRKSVRLTNKGRAIINQVLDIAKV